MATLTIRLDDELAARLEALTRRSGRSRSELVREMLRRQIRLDELNEVRAQLRPYADRVGYLSDEDFFRDFS